MVSSNYIRTAKDNILIYKLFKLKHCYKLNHCYRVQGNHQMSYTRIRELFLEFYKP